MKKLRVMMMLLVLSFASRAQVVSQVVIEPKPLKNSEVARAPHRGDENLAILESIKKEFPEPIVRTLTTIPARLYGKEWNVYISKESEETTPDYYEVEIRTKDGIRTAVYDKSGKLLRVKQIIKNADLPDAVQKTLNTKFKDWQIIDEEERISNAEKYTLEYKIKLKKGLLRKTVFINPEGSVKREFPL